MSTARELHEDERALAVRLETCEARIREAFRTGLEAKHACAKELITIEEGELYRARGYNSFKTYVEEELFLDAAAARSYMGGYRAMMVLADTGLKMPTNESQVLQLSKLSEERVPIVWDRVLRVCDKADRPVTITAIRKAIKLDEPPLDQKEKPKSGGVAPRIVVGPELSEDGERALNRIRRICGDQVAEALESGNVPLTEKAITKWAEQNDPLMKNLVYYVIDLRWSVRDAIAYEERLPSGSTTLEQMVLLARARGGRVAIQHDEFLITVERIAAA